MLFTWSRWLGKRPDTRTLIDWLWSDQCSKLQTYQDLGGKEGTLKLLSDAATEEAWAEDPQADEVIFRELIPTNFLKYSGETTQQNIM